MQAAQRVTLTLPAGWAPRRSASQLAFQAAERVAGRFPCRKSIPDVATFSLLGTALPVSSPFRRLPGMLISGPQARNPGTAPGSRPPGLVGGERRRPWAHGPGPCEEGASDISRREGTLALPPWDSLPERRVHGPWPMAKDLAICQMFIAEHPPPRGRPPRIPPFRLSGHPRYSLGCLTGSLGGCGRPALPPSSPSRWLGGMVPLR